MNWQLFGIYISSWYFCSIALSIYNRWMFDPKDGLGVTFPIILTSFHQFTLWFLSYIYIKVMDRNTTRTIPTVKWSFYAKFLIPTAVATAGDIGFSNVSFKFVPLSVYTIVKSSSIAFVLLFSCLFKLEKFHWKLGAIVSVMFVGVALMVYKPNSTSGEDTDEGTLVFGALLVLMSAALSGLRWVFTQLILKKRAPAQDATEANKIAALESQRENREDVKPEKPHPIYTIYQLAPIMGATLLITALIVERPIPGLFACNLFKTHFNPDLTITAVTGLRGFVLMVIPGVAVFVLTLSEFGILQMAKVLTLSVSGIVKEVLTILFGVWILHERISGVYNILGMSIVLLDVCYYNYFRYRQKTSVWTKTRYEHHPTKRQSNSYRQEKLPPLLLAVQTQMRTATNGTTSTTS
ncbi:Ymd8p KNAG_0B03360 [Huiozyma naganishii CBS 8797]|uniref:Sugar phosphate transporter domain-containing protein n=1 Tax=Huiozyma naganishii (strain ATCC MYA-139 / BCRC 22969 / CBS 8797 / KCTC 17520 / NBRC 10181 / NCYC 3082 / Yp74L-3) TaxID=1071383 RepID=J7RGW4_HUIN7|nr:hypothetical protein KNAG_0B03360 [Kazachstania naganishii CBS 8797]CCK68778.1 hypothetical protein KNAG_0B03360 [Kazachstania naganishii CBS 8797]